MSNFPQVANSTQRYNRHSRVFQTKPNPYSLTESLDLLEPLVGQRRPRVDTILVLTARLLTVQKYPQSAVNPDSSLPEYPSVRFCVYSALEYRAQDGSWNLARRPLRPQIWKQEDALRVRSSAAYGNPCRIELAPRNSLTSANAT